MQCSRCGKEAVLFQTYSGQYLCRNHFVADLEAKAKRAIRTHHWLKSGDHIAVAVSGDSASIALLWFLRHLTGERRDTRLSALCIDEGIAGFRNCARVEEIARSLGVEYTCGSFGTEYGVTIDEIAHKKGAAHACEYCRVLRCSFMDKLAQTRGVTKIALASSLDDGAWEVLADVLSGNAERLILSQRPTTAHPTPRILPFMDVPSDEIGLYAALEVKQYITGGPAAPACPYADGGPDKVIHAALDRYTRRHPGTRHALVNLRENLSHLQSGTKEPIPVCPNCGEPGGGTCRGCIIRSEVLKGLS